MSRSPEPAPDDPPDSRAVPAPSYESVWRVEDSESVAWDLPPRFELVRDLGDGPAGPMFVVRDAQRAGVDLRLEVLARSRACSPDERDALEARLRTVGRISAAHVANVLEVARLSDGCVFVLSEHEGGEILVARLARERKLHVAHALEVARQVLRGLESLHEAGLAHGSLSAASVWLAHRVEKRDSNPFGVRALLLGAAVAPAASPQAVGEDVRSVGELLEALLPDPSAGGELARAAHALADSLRQPVRDEHHAARAARAAVEELLARSTRAPAASARALLPRITLAAAALACAALGWFAWSTRAKSAETSRQAQLERERFALAQRDALARIDLLRGELAAGEITFNAQLDGIAASLVEGTALRERSERLEALAKEQLGRERARASTLETDLVERTAALAAAREQLAEALARSESSVRAARGLDATLALFELDDGERARTRALALEAEGLFGARSEFASNAAAALALVARFEQSRRSVEGLELDIAAADGAARAWVLAERQREEFLAQAAGWIDLRLNDSPARPRSERLGAALEVVRQRVRIAGAERELAHERDLFALRSDPQHDSLEHALAHAQRFACGHLDEFAESFVSALRSSLVAGGALDARRLRTSSDLAAWAARARSGAISLPPELARDLEWLDAARRWYDSSGPLEQQLALARAGAGPDASVWREQLALQWSLAQAWSQPAHAGEQAWRLDLDASGRREWWRDCVEAVDGAASVIRRTRLGEDGRTVLGEALLRLRTDSDSLRLVGARTLLVDVKSLGAEVRLERLPRSMLLEAPRVLSLPVVGAPQEGEACLVYRLGEIERWVSPRLGLVREEHATAHGPAITQLVALAR